MLPCERVFYPLSHLLLFSDQQLAEAMIHSLFSFLATLGVIMTFLGIEQILLTADILERHPMLILALGVAILALTGTLYKKLS